ncbi:TPA: preprotein translocase subunit SecE [Patescibacteria group bacterium]|nr:preprotein translocase subunit SecE [Candidatus Gracilibacteria bacterium]
MHLLLQKQSKLIKNTDVSLYIIFFVMMKFIYDSLETVKKLKHPTKKDFINITIAIFVAVILSSILFVLYDTVFT